MRTRSAHATALLFASLLAGCAQSALDRGAALYSDPGLSQSPSNFLACANCHAATVPADRRYPGYPMAGATARPSYWGGAYNNLLDAVNECYVEFMRAEKLTPDDPSGRALLVYLESLTGPQTAPTLQAAQPLTLVKNIDATYLSALPAGDPTRGQALYVSTCSPCHGDTHTGNGRLSPLVSIVPEDTIALFGAATAPAVIAEKVRHGKFFGISGNMPFYSIEAMSDAELADVLSYVLR